MVEKFFFAKVDGLAAGTVLVAVYCWQNLKNPTRLFRRSFISEQVVVGTVLARFVCSHLVEVPERVLSALVVLVVR